MPADALANLPEARLALAAAERELERFEPEGPARHLAEALLRLAQIE